MRVCRYRHEGRLELGFYDERRIVPLSAAAESYRTAVRSAAELPATDNMLDVLPPHGQAYVAARQISDWLGKGVTEEDLPSLAPSDVQLLVPVPRPNKLFLLAGNYTKHIEEGGDTAAERGETFPYVFMKPPTTTLTDPGGTVHIPDISPDHIDWELELAVIIGREAKGVSEADALNYVAGYTVINDISNRRFRPNPGREQRPRDKFFDWLHGKWHDSFCPCGPCVASPDAIADPQQLQLELRVNGEVRQSASTAQHIFPVASVIEFISSFVTLEPGDIISTGTPHGVGHASGTYLKPGDRIEASISDIGVLVSTVA